MLGGGADEALSEGHVVLADDALAVAGAEAVFELLGPLVPEQDGEHVEVDDALEQGADAFEQRSSGSRMLVISREISCRTVRVWAWRETRV